MQTILMAVTPEARAIAEAMTIMTICIMQVPMSALLLLRAMSMNRIRTSPKAHAANTVAVTAVVLAEKLMEVNKAADS